MIHGAERVWRQVAARQPDQLDVRLRLFDLALLNEEEGALEDGLCVQRERFRRRTAPVAEGNQGAPAAVRAGVCLQRRVCRADILNPVGRDAWDIVEVKSAIEIKDVNLLDLAFQEFVYTGAGLRIRRCWLMHVHKEYTRYGKIRSNGVRPQSNACCRC